MTTMTINTSPLFFDAEVQLRCATWIFFCKHSCTFCVSVACVKAFNLLHGNMASAFSCDYSNLCWSVLVHVHSHERKIGPPNEFMDNSVAEHAFSYVCVCVCVCVCV